MKEVIEKVKEINEEYHYFNTVVDNVEKGKGKLSGVAVSVKDCICVKGVESTAGSRILKGYRPLFDATVIEKIKKAGGSIIGKTSQDEFGFGGFSANVGLDYDRPLNPFDKERACGGSSGGSAGITQKADFSHISLAESTGGSIVNPASFCGVVGLCPTYGRVSRYGLLDYANSLDKIGPMAKRVTDVALMMNIISGYDPKDSTSLDAPVPDHTKLEGVKGLKIGVIKEGFSDGVDSEVKDMVWDSIKTLESEGATYKEISLPLTMKYGVAAYYLIAMTEASTNLSKYCGMRYGMHEPLHGNFNEYFSKVRSKHFGEEAKRRVIIGTFARMAGFRDAYYLKATKVRTLIIEEYKKLFKEFDVLASPTVPILPPRFDEIEKMSPLKQYMMDVLTVGPNLAGLPHINMPVGFSKGLPVGGMFIGNHLKEIEVLRAARGIEDG